jgi:hypothetical protein
MALSVPLSRFTSRVGGGSAFFVRLLRHHENSSIQIGHRSSVMRFRFACVVLLASLWPDSFGQFHREGVQVYAGYD